MRNGLMAVLAATTTVGCGPERINADLLKALETKILMPGCARGAVVTVEDGYDGLSGRDLAASFEVDDQCKERWWETLQASDAYECEIAAHHRACDFGKLGDFLTGENGGIMLMPRDDDMLLAKSSKPRITD